MYLTIVIEIGIEILDMVIIEAIEMDLMLGIVVMKVMKMMVVRMRLEIADVKFS